MLKRFKQFMHVKHPDYLLVNDGNDVLAYKLEVPAKNPNLGTAGCLLLLGVIPGIIYFLVARSNAKILTLNIIENEGQLKISGDKSGAFANEFNRWSKVN